MGTGAGIEAAEKQIKSILVEAPYTHFISLPLAIHPDLLQQVEKFQESILARNQPTTATTQKEQDVILDEANKSGIDESIFVKPLTFHLTVLMLKLWNEERVQQAAEVLEKTEAALHETLEGKPVVLDFKGVEIMSANPEKAHVLFACVVDSDDKSRLLQACQVLIDAYVESDLVMEKDIGHALKLHATLMNTSKRPVEGNHRFGNRIPFDATEVLELYSEWEWGAFGIQEAHLSQRSVYGEDGYYQCVKSIPFPTQELFSSIQVESAPV